MRKVSIVLLLLFLLNYCNSTYCQTYKSYNDCSFLTKTASSETPPEWDDDRLDTYDGRVSIIRQASKKIFSKLQNCDDVQFYTYSNMKYSKDGTDMYNKWISGETEPDFMECCFMKLKINLQASYSQIQRRANTGARVNKEYYVEKWTMTYSEIGGASQQLNMKDQTFSFDIEVFPMVFESRELYIPSEERYARNPVEAIQYVILHELGHAESYFTKNYVPNEYEYSTKPYEVFNTENDAWEFASSVMLCLNKGEKNEIDNTHSNIGSITVNNLKVDVKHNVIVNGEKGMKIYPMFNVKNAKGLNLSIIVYFYFQNGEPVKFFNGRFKTSDGNVAVVTEINPCCESTDISMGSTYDFFLFMPYDELHLPSNKKHELKFKINVFQGNVFITGNDWEYFTVTK